MASDAVPLWVIALEAIVGLFVPLLIAAYPVFRGSRITIREAISDYGVKNNGRRNQNEKRNRVIFSFIPRSFLMSLRNTFRKRGRILLTLFTLVMGGAIFIGTLIIKDSLANNIDSWIATQPYQLEFRFSGRYDARDLEKAMRDAPGVGRAEGLLVVGAVPVGKEGGSGNPLVVAAPFNASAYADYPLSSGRWFSERETNALVINQIVEDPQKGWVTGGRVSLRIGGVTAEWEIVGSVKQLDDPVVFASFPGVAAASGRDKLINAVAINVLDSGTQSVKALERDLETRLERAGFQIKEGKSVFLRKEILDEHLVIITFFMMAASILALAVGGMGLASMLSVSVFERRREIGIMRAVGASGRSVMGIIVSEGIIIGLISFLFACLLSLPLAFVVGNMVSNTLQSITLDFVFPPGAFIAWLLGVIGLSIAASIFPARQAALLTVREAVSYE
jgi:putative ABC transport system permease protein